MRTYLVSYDLTNPALNQPYITEAIMSLGEAWARPLANVWYLRTDREQSAIEGRLARLLDEHDGLLVQAVREDAGFRNTGLRWIRRRNREDLDTSNVVAFPAPTETNATPVFEIGEDAPLRVAS